MFHSLQTYLGIQIFRFYFKCTRCSAEITFKTDPQNSDYTVESGASRNFEPWRDEEEVNDCFLATVFWHCFWLINLYCILLFSFVILYSYQATEKEKRKRTEEEMGDAMKSLENRAVDSKQDMDILAALEEMRSMKVLKLVLHIWLTDDILKNSFFRKQMESCPNHFCSIVQSRHATVSVDLMLETLKQSAYEKVNAFMIPISFSLFFSLVCFMKACTFVVVI